MVPKVLQHDMYKNPYIINQNHIFSKNYSEVISAKQWIVIFSWCGGKIVYNSASYAILTIRSLSYRAVKET
jgi:hypothetical protein